jgi:adenylate kinase family enzyme
MRFPIFKTKAKGLRSFNLTDPKERKIYFEAKAGKEIRKLRNYLKEGNTFIVYLLGKKNSGKGTYAKLFMEAVDEKRVAQISIGDLVRKIHQEIADEKKKRELINFLEQNYRGFLPIKETIQALLKRSTETLLPTEFILALVKKEIMAMERKALFIDGFPRDLDQVSYSLFFRDLIDYREDPDIFVLIDVPESVIVARMKWRVICPRCQNSKNLKLYATKKVKYDEKKKKFYFVCDNPRCQGARMISKEGDVLGIKPIRKRLKLDEKLIKQAFLLQGIPKVLLRNTVPVKEAKKYIDDYEITPEYVYQWQWDGKAKKVKIIEKPWVMTDDKGVTSYSLLPAPVAVSLIKQMANILCP